MPNTPSISVTRKSVLVAQTTMWEIESDSVGNGRPFAAESPGQPGSVGTPLRGVDRTGGFMSTKPSSCGSVRGFQRHLGPPPGRSGRREPTSDTPLPCPGRLSTGSGRDGTTGVVTSPADRLSQAIRGGSGPALVPPTVVVTAVADSGAHVVSDLVFHRAGSLRDFFSPEVFLVRNS